MRKLLIISYYWPPAGGPGVQRWVKFVKYLTKAGYECHVVTVREDYASYPSIDKTLEKDFGPLVKVTRTKSFEVLKIFASIFRKEKVPYAGIPDKTSMSFIGRLALYIRSNFFIPDARIGWNDYALDACRKIIGQENIDMIVSTSPPHSSQLIGLQLKKEFPRIRWVADMRDPWTDIYYYPKLSHTERSKKQDRKLEEEVLLHANLVTTVSKDLRKLFLKKSEMIHPDKVQVLPNGFDASDFENINPEPNEVFTIAHTGTINSNYNISGFLQAYKKLSVKVKIHFVGNVDTTIKKLLTDVIPDIEFTPYVSHTEAIKIMCNADLLLLAIPDNKDNKGILTGKLFEYLAAQKPILCLGPPIGDAANTIRDCNAGKTYSFEDFENMYLYTNSIYEVWQAKKTTKLTSTLYHKYSREELAKEFSKLTELLF